MSKKVSKIEDVNRPIEVPANNTQTALQASTEFLLKPSFLAAKVIDSDKKQLSKDFIDLQYTQSMLEKSIGEISKGNLLELESMLFSQAYALNTMFATLMTRANRQEYLPPTQTLMTLAFKAQNQCRTTLETLINLKTPSHTAFIKQANISHGHQQVNNLIKKNEISKNELLRNGHAKLDTRGKTKAKRIDPIMETLDKINGSKNC